jgi:hypothetical protein
MQYLTDACAPPGAGPLRSELGPPAYVARGGVVRNDRHGAVVREVDELDNAIRRRFAMHLLVAS